jgi:hypothetical protein
MAPILMTNAQFYFALSVPLLGILVNVVLTNMLSHRVDRLEDRLEDRLARLEERVHSGFDLLTGKIGELDNRITRLEERLAR